MGLIKRLYDDFKRDGIICWWSKGVLISAIFSVLVFIALKSVMGVTISMLTLITLIFVLIGLDETLCSHDEK